MATDIPGFYYDEVKGKFFKILPGHVAPSGAVYTHRGVRLEKNKKAEREKLANIRTTRLRTTVKRNPILLSYGSGFPLSFETGRCTKAPRESAALMWTETLRKQNKRILTADLARSPLLKVVSFLKDELTGAILVARNDYTSAELCCYVPESLEDGELSYGDEGKLYLEYVSGDGISSMCMTSTRIFAYTTLCGEESGGTIHMVKLGQPTGFFPERTWPDYTEGPEFILRLRSNLSHNSIFHCDANADPNHPAIAIAISRGLICFTPNHSMSNDYCLESFDEKSDVLFVKWLSRTTVAAGIRNGAVMLYDMRSRDHIQRLQFPSSVCKLGRIDDSRLLVAGLSDNMHLYDLRFCPAPSTPFNSSVPNHSKPYISYPTYRNEGRYDLGFDVSARLGLAAAATEDNQIKMFNLWTGQELVSSCIKNHRWEEMIKVIRFVGEDDGMQNSNVLNRRGLLIGAGSTVEEWGW